MYGMLTPAGKKLHVTPGLESALIYIPKTHSYAQQPAQAGTEFSMTPNTKIQSYPHTMKQQHESPAPWKPVALGQSKEFPTIQGENCVFWISAKPAGINCARKTNLL